MKREADIFKYDEVSKTFSNATYLQNFYPVSFVTAGLRYLIVEVLDKMPF